MAESFARESCPVGRVGPWTVCNQRFSAVRSLFQKDNNGAE